MSELYNDLARFELLRDLGIEERAALSQFLRERDASKGTVLFRAGDEASEMIFLAEGSVTVQSAGGEELGRLEAGNVVGGACLVSIGGRECDVVVAEPARVLVLDREGYLRLRGDFPTVALALQEGVLREMSSTAREIATSDG